MKRVLLICVLFALVVTQCPTTTSSWRIKDLPVAGNNINLRFQKRVDAAGQCLHYFQIRSLCTLYEATYTTTHGTGVIPYTINVDTTPPVNLGGCPNLNIASQEASIIASFYARPRSGWYHLFLPPFVLPNNKKLAWGGYIADWVNGPGQIWFP